MKINNSCVLEHIKTLPDNSVKKDITDITDIIISNKETIPYFLSSSFEFVNGKVQVKGNSSDFMKNYENN